MMRCGLDAPSARSADTVQDPEVPMSNASSKPRVAMEDVLGHPGAGLVYLVFVYLALLFWRGWDWWILVASIAVTLVFLPLYFAFFRRDPAPRWIVLAVAALGFCLMLVNPGGNTLVIYAMGMAAAAFPPRRAIALGLLFVVLSALIYQWSLRGTNFALPYTLMVVVIGGIVLLGALYSRQRAARNAELRLTQDEVRRLARLAERERIGRDLHDLLGHTLSLVVLKSELAGKLVERDAAAAKQQIGEVEQVARQALAQVREAVSGMRAGGLEAELASARLALLSADVRFDQQIAPLALSQEVESALALGLREAVTNAIRHAAPTRFEVELVQNDGMAELRIADDGRGGIARAGNGLAGMRERIEALGGTLDVDSPVGAGTRLCLRVPLPRTPAEREPA